MLSYIIAAILAYLGLIAGIIIIHVAKEEQKPGMSYFLLFQDLLLCTSVAFFVYFLGLNTFINLSLTFLALLLLFLIRQVQKTYFIFPLFGIILFIVSDSPSFLAVEASLLFIIGLTASALLYDQRSKKQSIRKIIVYHLGFFITALLPLLLRVRL